MRKPMPKDKRAQRAQRIKLKHGMLLPDEVSIKLCDKKFKSRAGHEYTAVFADGIVYKYNHNARLLDEEELKLVHGKTSKIYWKFSPWQAQKACLKAGLRIPKLIGTTKDNKGNVVFLLEYIPRITKRQFKTHEKEIWEMWEKAYQKGILIEAPHEINLGNFGFKNGKIYFLDIYQAVKLPKKDLEKQIFELTFTKQ